MFNQNKYQKCIKHLISIKTITIFLFIVMFSVAGIILGLSIMNTIGCKENVVVISAIAGSVVGFIFGLTSIWRTDMKIQEAYLRMDLYKALKKDNKDVD